MRIIVVLILTAALAWVFLKLFPSTNETLAAVGASEVAEGPAAGNSAPVGRTAADGSASPAPAQRQPELLPAAAPEPIARSEAASTAAGAVDRQSPEESALGALLAHGHLAALEQQLQRPGSRLSEPRRAMLLSFVEAMTGRRDNGLERAQGPGVASSASAREQELLRVALGLAPYPPSAGAARPAPVERGLEMALAAQSAERASVEGRVVDAARGYSRLILMAFEAPWPADLGSLAAWSESLERAQERHRWNPRGDWPHFELTVEPGDSLVAVRLRAIAQRPELHLSTGLIARANGLSSEVIHPGDVLRIPTDPVRVEVRVDLRWMMYLHGEEVVGAWPVGVGREGSETLVGEFVVGGKQKDPTWWPRGRNPVPFGDPENPLGTRWIAWRALGESKDTSYGFHGTKDPSSIGKADSEGCIRMHNERVEKLFEILPVGASVRVR